MPSQRSLRRDRAMNLSLMNTVNVVFSRFICYLIWFSVIVILALNLLGLERRSASPPGRKTMKLPAHLALPSKHWDVYYFAKRDLKQDGCFWQPANLPQAAEFSVRIIFWNNITLVMIGWVYFDSPVFFVISILYLKVVEKHGTNEGETGQYFFDWSHLIFISGERTW